VVGNKASKRSAKSIEQATTAQGQNNLDTAKLQNLLNNPNINTPYGSQNVTIGPDGRPIVNQTLSPAEQAKLDQTNKYGTGALDIALGQLPALKESLGQKFGLEGQAQTDYDPRYAPQGRVPTNLDFSGAPPMPEASPEVLQQVIDAIYGSGAQYLDPQYARSEDQMRSRLANQGIMSGAEVAGAGGNPAYNNEMDKFDESKRKAYSDLRMSSILGGQDAMKNLYNMALQGRQQGVGEISAAGEFGQKGILDQANIAANQAQLANQGRTQNYSEYLQNRTMPLNITNALLTQGQVNSPQFGAQQPTTIAPAPILAGAQTGAQIGAANQSANAGIYGNAVTALSRIAQGWKPVTPDAPIDYTQGAGK
jgi:hypothetical protein